MKEAEIRAYWSTRLPTELPVWKRWVWRIFGKRRTGSAEGLSFIGYQFRGITLVWETRDEETGDIVEMAGVDHD